MSSTATARSSRWHRLSLPLTATTNTKTYDTNTSAAANPTVSGLLGSDTVTDLAETYADAHVGAGKTLSVTAYTINDGTAEHASHHSVFQVNRHWCAS